jgi:2-polyprenyl-3-methyl-5-hydroxy-6-metoxy-1,4-benzoquinol methylase
MAFHHELKVDNSNFSQNPDFAVDGYLYEALLPENVFGHTKKVMLFREAIERLRAASKKRSLRILDIGCGSGYAVTRFLGKTSDHVMGIDMHPPNIAYAKKHFSHSSLHFSCMNAQSLFSNGEVFDIVVMGDVLEHLDDPASILKIAVELLTPDGRLLVTVPNGRGPFEIESALSRVPFLGQGLLKLTDFFVAVLNKTIMKGAWSKVAAVAPKDLPYNIESGHVQLFAKDNMVNLFKGAGMQIASARNISFLSGPFTNYLFSPYEGFCAWNSKVADQLPSWFASAWFFECCRIQSKD